MNNKVKELFMFASGVAIGSVVTWKFLETKYEQLIQEEIESVREVYKRDYEPSEPAECIEEEIGSMQKAADDAKDKPSIVEYASMLQKEGYTDYSAISKKEEKKEVAAIVDGPYVIPPEEFGEFDEYRQISLTYYSDGVLTDDNNDIIDDVEEVVGSESLKHFGEYEDDAVHVRNDRLKCDYEILQVEDKYSDD